MHFGQKSSVRRRVANYLDRTSLGLYLELVQAVLSVCSCAVYVGESYYKDDVPRWMEIVDLVLVIVFLADFCLHLFLAEKKLAYALSRDGVIDIVTVMPVLVGMMAADYSAYRHIFFFLRPLRVLRAVRILRFLPAATKSTAARRQLILLIFSASCLVFIFSGLFQYVENSSLLGDTIVRGKDGIHHFLPFHEAVYFIVILAYTVSFGDPVPTNWLGKFVAMTYMTVTALVIPLQIRKLIKILALQKDGGWVVKSKKNPHFIATGSINPSNITNFLNDFFDERNKHDKTKVVVLSSIVRDDEIEIIHSPFIENKVVWLLGSVLVPIDLLRSRASAAKGAFIFANHFASDPNKEDKLNIMRALALRKHNPHIPVSVQLIDSSWKAHLADDSVFAFALDEIKLSMMAWSTLYPGYSTLISNMLMWRLQITLPLNPSPWLREYVDGLNQTVFEAEIPNKYLTDTFSAVILDIFNQYGITVIGVRKAGSRKIKLAPLNVSMDDRLSIGDSFIMLADATQLQDFCGLENRFVKDLYLGDSRRRSTFEAVPLIGKLVRKRDVIIESFGLDIQRDHQELVDEAAVTGENTDVFFHGTYEEPEGWSNRKSRKVVRAIDHQDIMAPRSAFRPPSILSPKEMHRVSPTKYLVDLGEPTKSKIRTLESCTVTKIEKQVRSHIVLCGCPRSRFGLFHFMQPYLNPSRHAGESSAPILVVVLAPEPPSPTTWAEVAEMPNILYIRGSGINAEHLRAAGVERARSVVVLSTSAGHGGSGSKGKKGHVESADNLYLQDADVILITRAIHNNITAQGQPNVFTISETAHTKTFNLLAYNNAESAEFFLSPEFAAGYFYDSGMTERLIYQCHEKQFIRDMLGKLFTSKQKKRSTFIAQIPIPPNLEKMTYGSLFTFSVPHNMIPIGLYRAVEDDELGGGETMRYFVILNPAASTILKPQDRVFVWCSMVR